MDMTGTTTLSWSRRWSFDAYEASTRGSGGSFVSRGGRGSLHSMSQCPAAGERKDYSRTFWEAEWRGAEADSGGCRKRNGFPTRVGATRGSSARREQPRGQTVRCPQS